MDFFSLVDKTRRNGQDFELKSWIKEWEEPVVPDEGGNKGTKCSYTCHGVGEECQVAESGQSKRKRTGLCTSEKSHGRCFEATKNIDIQNGPMECQRCREFCDQENYNGAKRIEKEIYDTEDIGHPNVHPSR